MRPLDELVVVELGDHVAARYCGQLLASLGAKVIRVTEPAQALAAEAPFMPDALTHEGALRRLHLDVDKQSLVLSYSRPEGRALLRRLIGRADVLVDGLGAGRAAQLGLDYDTLRTSEPRLIVAALSWFGQTGPYHELLATDLTCSALSGYLGLNGHPRQPPLNLPTPLGQYLAGLSAAIGICALACAEADYVGSRQLDVSVQESLALQLAGAATDAARSGTVAVRAGNRMVARNGGRTYTGVLPCADGYVVVAVVGEADYQRLAALGLDVSTLPDSARARPGSEPDAIDALITPWLAERKRSQVSEEAQLVGLHWSEILGPGEAVTTEQAAERGVLAEYAHPIFGRLPFVTAPLRWADSPAPTGVALLGADTQRVLSNILGLKLDQMRALISNEVI